MLYCYFLFGLFGIVFAKEKVSFLLLQKTAWCVVRQVVFLFVCLMARNLFTVSFADNVVFGKIGYPERVGLRFPEIGRDCEKKFIRRSTEVKAIVVNMVMDLCCVRCRRG